MFSMVAGVLKHYTAIFWFIHPLPGGRGLLEPIPAVQSHPRSISYFLLLTCKEVSKPNQTYILVKSEHFEGKNIITVSTQHDQ